MLVFAQEENLESIGIITTEIINSEVYHPGYPDYRSPDLETNIKLYTEPGINSGKRIVQQWELTGKAALLFTWIIGEDGNKKKPEIEKSSFVWTSYKSVCFQYSDVKDGYLKVKLNNAFYWLNQSEIEQNNFQPILWMDYLTNLKSEFLTANVNLNLRAYPDIQAQRIKLLKINGNNKKSHYMKMTGKTNGKWAKVEVQIYMQYCWNKELLKTLIGWIKVIDDDGSPNIFSVPSPCC